jgi:SPX domain protein involved in polyphosphate accumulation
MPIKAAEAVSPLLLNRYELKYVIPYSLVEPISKFIEPYCDMDFYSKIAPDGFYTINSLYLDTPTLYLLRLKLAGIPNRFSLRVRSYGNEPKLPYYFECKQKVRGFTKKIRGRVEFENWQEILTDESLLNFISPESKANVADFVQRSATYNVSPVILTQYRRRAFLSSVDSYARVTFDRDLRYQDETEYNVTPNERMLRHYDDPECFGVPMNNVVLELKCEQRIPRWMIDLIQRFELRHGTFSKYGYSMVRQYMAQWGRESMDMHPSELFAPREGRLW